jgi:hypothetical protein
VDSALRSDSKEMVRLWQVDARGKTRRADHSSDFGMATGTDLPIKCGGAADLCSR